MQDMTGKMTKVFSYFSTIVFIYTYDFTLHILHIKIIHCYIDD